MGLANVRMDIQEPHVKQLLILVRTSTVELMALVQVVLVNAGMDLPVHCAKMIPVRTSTVDLMVLVLMECALVLMGGVEKDARFPQIIPKGLAQLHKLCQNFCSLVVLFFLRFKLEFES